MTHTATSFGRFAFIAGLAFSTSLLPACATKDAGCEKDADCKGERVCVERACVEPGGAKPGPLAASPVTPALLSAAPSPTPIPPPAPGSIGADGLPLDIPSPGSAAPSVAEWNAVTREISVANSTRLNCETKMVREWLRVTCRKNAKGEPVDARHLRQSGQQAFQFTGNGLASLVVQVVRGKDYQGAFNWTRGGANLAVSWPHGAPRPSITLTER